jgi:hypothetical protein
VNCELSELSSHMCVVRVYYVTAIFKMVFPQLAESKSKCFAKEQVGVIPWRC